jgi:hypothetical protein
VRRFFATRGSGFFFLDKQARCFANSASLNGSDSSGGHFPRRVLRLFQTCNRRESARAGQTMSNNKYQILCLSSLLSILTGFLLSGCPKAPERPQHVTVDRVVVHFTPPANFQLQSQHPLTKVLTPSDQLPAMPSSGFWFELQSASGEVKYRRIIGNPVWPPGFTGPPPLERVFTLLIPSPLEGDQLVLFSSPLTPEGQSQPAQPVARFKLVPNKIR